MVNLIDQLFDEDLEQFLLNLPNDNNSNFTKLITEYIALAPIEIEQKLLTILNHHGEPEIRFAAFYSLVVYYRRYKATSKLEYLANEYGIHFSHKPLFKFTMSTLYKNKGNKSGITLAIEYAQDAIEQVVNYPGYFNNYAEIVAYALEEGIKIDNSEMLISRAFQYINKAIMINNKYAKYYCTLGRLQCCNGEYHDAKQNILTAIDLEDNSKNDYSIRIADYQYFLLKCQSSEAINLLTKTINEKTTEIQNLKTEVQKNLQDEKNKSLEFLVFFTAIITFIVSTVQIASKSSFNEAVSLILVMLGGLLISFGSFSILLNFDRKSFISTATFVVVGTGIIILALVLK